MYTKSAFRWFCLWLCLMPITIACSPQSGVGLFSNKEERAREAFNQGVQIDRQAYLYIEYEEALGYMNEAIDINSDFAAAWAYKAGILEALDRSEEALQHMARANQLDSTDPFVAAFDAYFIFEETGSTQSAFVRIMPILENPATSNGMEMIYRRAAFLLNEDEEYEKAIQFANLAIGVDASYISAYSEKRYAQSSLGINNTDDALLRKALETSDIELKLSPNCHYCYFGRAFIFSHLNLDADAVANIEKAIALADDEGSTFEDLPTLYIEQAYHYVELRNLQNARGSLNKALELGVDNYPQYYFVEGYAADAINNYDQAFTSYMTFLKLEGDDYGRTRYACSRANELEIFTTEDLLSGFISIFTTPCDRYPSQQSGGGGTYNSQTNEVTCEEYFGQVPDGYGGLVTESKVVCTDSYGRQCNTPYGTCTP